MAFNYVKFFSSGIEDYNFYLQEVEELLNRLSNEPNYYKKEILAEYLKNVCEIDYQEAFDEGYSLALEHDKEEEKEREGW